MQRFIKIREALCRDCGTQLVKQYTLRTLFQGWWGFISFFVNWFVLVANVAAYVELSQLRSGHELSD